MLTQQEVNGQGSLEVVIHRNFILGKKWAREGKIMFRVVVGKYRLAIEKKKELDFVREEMHRGMGVTVWVIMKD